MFEYVSPKCRPYRGFLVTTGFVSHGFRRGLRCDVPPGLSTTPNWSTTPIVVRPLTSCSLICIRSKSGRCRTNRRVVDYVRVCESEVPPLSGLSCHYGLCFPRLPPWATV